MRRVLNVVLLLAACCLTLGLPSLASADPVLLTVGVDVKPGKLDEYVAAVSKGRAVINRLGVQGTMRIWRATVAGDDTGGVVVGMEYPSLTAYADATTKLQADSEWRSLVAGLDGLRTLMGSSLYRALDVGSTSGSAGSTLQAVAVRVKPGKLDAYLGEVKKLKAIQKRLGADSRLRVWQASVAGEDTGTVIVALEYASLAAFADATTKMERDAGWSGIVGGLDAMRTIVASGLYQELKP